MCPAMICIVTMTLDMCKHHSVPGITRQSGEEGHGAPPTWNVLWGVHRGDTHVGRAVRRNGWCVFDNPPSVLLRAILFKFSVELVCKFAANQDSVGRFSLQRMSLHRSPRLQIYGHFFQTESSTWNFCVRNREHFTSFCAH